MQKAKQFQINILSLSFVLGTHRWIHVGVAAFAFSQQLTARLDVRERERGLRIQDLFQGERVRMLGVGLQYGTNVWGSQKVFICERMQPWAWTLVVLLPLTSYLIPFIEWHTVI